MGATVQLRVVGAADDVGAMVAALRQALTVVSVSRPYPSRRERGQVRVYVEVAAPTDGGPADDGWGWAA